MAVDLLADMGVVQDAPVAHHGAADALGAAGGKAGQEQLLLGHRREAGHDLLHHWDRGPSVRAREGEGGRPPGPWPRAQHSREWLSSMKPKGGAKCSRRFHSLWLKWLESRKRVRLGRKRCWSHSDVEAVTFKESGQA